MDEKLSKLCRVIAEDITGHVKIMNEVNGKEGRSWESIGPEEKMMVSQIVEIVLDSAWNTEDEFYEVYKFAFKCIIKSRRKDFYPPLSALSEESKEENLIIYNTVMMHFQRYMEENNKKAP